MKLEKYKIQESIGNIETHEVFLDSLAHIKEEEFGLSEKRFEVAIKTKVIGAIFGLFFLLAMILFLKTAYLQVFKGDAMRQIVKNNKGSISLVRAERGIIYDSNLQKLAVNSPAYDLICRPAGRQATSNFSNGIFQKEVGLLSESLHKTSAEIESAFRDSTEPVVLLAENISQEPLLILEARIEELPDCQIEKNTTRNYVMGQAFSHVLGYTSQKIGKTGLENYYEEELRGTPGQTEIIKTASGVQKSNTIISEPQAGGNLVLNINADLQKAVYNSLEKSIKNVGSKKGAAVALDPRTGAVLAMVSYPSYDDNIFSQGISQSAYQKLVNDPYQPFFNRVAGAKYPSGSTIKPFLASGALQENIISPTKLINDPGYILVQSQNDPTVTYKFSGVAPHGLVDMRKAIAVSSNIYFFTIGGGYGDQKGLGPAGIKKYLDMYGFEQKTGVDLPGEFKGFVPSPTWKKEVKKEQWWDGDTYNLSIGQSDLQVTPLQVAVAYSAIANGGTLYKPQIVKKVVSSVDANSIMRQFEPEVLGQLSIDPANLDVVRLGMRDAVHQEYGGSLMLNNLGVDVAGKTGTVETGRAGVYNTWSSSFAPFDNPEIVFVATIEGVQGLRSATLPVAHDVLDYYFNKK